MYIEDLSLEKALLLFGPQLRPTCAQPPSSLVSSLGALLAHKIGSLCATEITALSLKATKLAPNAFEPNGNKWQQVPQLSFD